MTIIGKSTYWISNPRPEGFVPVPYQRRWVRLPKLDSEFRHTKKIKVRLYTYKAAEISAYRTGDYAWDAPDRRWLWTTTKIIQKWKRLRSSSGWSGWNQTYFRSWSWQDFGGGGGGGGSAG